MTPSKTHGPCRDHSWISRTMGPLDRERRLRRLTACVVGRWWPGHLDTVAYIIDRESGGNPFATNPDEPGACRVGSDNAYGSCGLGQHLARYWAGRAVSFLSPAWFKTWPAPWWNARANLIVTVKMMAAQNGACPAWC